MRVKIRLLAASMLAISLTGLGGCTSSSRIFETTNMGSFGKVVSVDGRQRFLIYGSSAATDAQGRPLRSGIFWWQRLRRFCAEPSPDVFSVAAAAYGMSGEARYAGPNNIGLSGSLSMSSSEAASVISRTQTINMLREAMYRNCERYLNGAITPEEHTIQAIRDQRIMVSILAIEQITGVYRATSESITAQANATSASDSTMRAVLLLQELRNQEQKSKTAFESAQADKATRVAACGKTPPESDKCSESDLELLDAAVRSAQQKLQQDKENRSAIESRIPTSTASAPVPGNSAVEASSQSRNAASTDQNTDIDSKMLQTIESIVESTFETDELQLLCIRLLLRNLPPSDQQKEVLAKCTNEVKKEIENSGLGKASPVNPTPSPPPSAPPRAAPP